MKLEKNLFDLTQKGIDNSKMMYNGKIIKCLVAPYHTGRTIEIDYAPNIMMFPEKELSAQQKTRFVSMITNSALEEVLIITSDTSIILDMIDSSVRILTEFDTIVETPVKTFAANIHDIRYSILENKDHQKTVVEKTKNHEEIQKVLDKINSGKPVSQKEYDEMMSVIDKIGEPIIANIMKNHMETVKIK
jgi:AICAR transformylase/IMP cyclohydrolase PurH